MLFHPEGLDFIHSYQKQLAITLQRCRQELTVAQLTDACYFTQKHSTNHLFSWSGPASRKLESNTSFSFDFSRCWIISLKCILLLLRNEHLYTARYFFFLHFAHFKFFTFFFLHFAFTSTVVKMSKWSWKVGEYCCNFHSSCCCASVEFYSKYFNLLLIRPWITFLH